METRVVIKKKKQRKFVWLLVLPLLITFFSVTGYGAYLYFKASAAAEGSFNILKRGNKSEMRTEIVKPLEDNISVLFMGIDDSEKRKDQYGEAVRTDALILATFNRKDNSIKLVSIPRDSYVYLEVEGRKDKINHAHAFGGPDATITAVEQLLDVPVDYYVRLNFEAFMQVIDTLGGIEVDVPITFTEQDSRDKAGAITLEKGLQTLDGEQALALVRTRKIDSDLERGKRQQIVLESILKKAMTVESITKYGKLIDALGSNLTTNLTFDDMMSFMYYASNARTLEIESLQLKGQDAYLPTNSGGRIYYFSLDEEYTTKLQRTLRTHLDLSVEEQEIIEDMNGEEQAEDSNSRKTILTDDSSN